jgi:hypothetical protein
MHTDFWRNYNAVKDIDPSYCFWILKAMLDSTKRGFLVEEALLWMPVIDLILPFLQKSSAVPVDTI